MLSPEFSKKVMDQGITFHPVVPFDKGYDRFKAIDLSPANKQLSVDLLKDIKAFEKYINHLLLQNKTRYGIGGYAELRNVYSTSAVFDGTLPGDEPRRFHLGTDIWGKASTAVMCPLDGVVHSYAFNNAKGDYGATIILTHQIGDQTFYTLYGHLSLDSIKNLRQGQKINSGNVFAEFGIPAENGQWPPHLHFQIILEMNNREGDYPGVCKYSERENWLQNSPDPEIILQLRSYTI
ncbi:MAG TPA: peptidoglycan DD-metalloendopeptidase family protein [Chitinophagaceae bacterium]|nr:peptidoglycan DD-metalloendopeptidase family protein [Chitinophagaceae bacterium]